MVFFFLGCPTPISSGPPSPANWEGELEAVGVDLTAEDGPIGKVWIRSVNTHGATTAGPSVSLEVNGASQTVSFDSSGVASLTFPNAGANEVRFGELVARVVSYGAEWPGLGGFNHGSPAPEPTRGEAVAAGNGAVFFAQNRLWWTSPEHAPRTELVAPAPITRVRAAHLDADGVLDLAVATEASAFLLRGREEGGFVYVGRISATAPLISLELGDADDDGIGDVSLIWAVEQADLLDVWRGDGFLGFAPGPARQLIERGVSVTVANAHGDGMEVSVGNDQGTFDQYYANGEVFQATGPLLAIDLPIPNVASSGGDVDGDGSDDLFFGSVYQPGVPRRLAMFSLGDDPRITTLDRQVAAHFSVHDATQDGRPDVIFSETGGAVSIIRHNGEGTNTVQLGSTSGGPVAFAEGDTTFMVAEEDRWMWTETEPADDRFLVIRNRRLVNTGLTVRNGKYVVGSFDGDAVPDVVGLRPGGLNTEVRVWSVTADSVTTRGRLTLSDAEHNVRDIDLCGSVAWVLYDTALFAIDVSDPDHPVSLGSVVIVADQVACGAGPLGPAAVLTADSIINIGPDFQQVKTRPSLGATNLWLDSFGVLSCTREDCGAVRVVGPDGPIVFTGSPEGALRDGMSVPGRGAPVVTDVDHNGFADVVFHHEGEVAVHRGTAGGFGTAELFQTFERFSGTLTFLDLDLDGYDDAWGLDLENDRIKISPSLNPIAGPGPGDTSDTSDTGIVVPGDTSDTGGSTGHTGTP